MQFVWFLGGSAVGKASTIEKCLRNPSWAAETFGFDVSKGLQRLASGKLPTPDFNGTALIKWQIADDKDVSWLQEQRPNDQHIAILLRPHPTERVERWLHKYRDRLKDDPVWKSTLENKAELDEKLSQYLAADEAKSLTHRGKVNQFLEFLIQDGEYTLIPEFA